MIYDAAKPNASVAMSLSLTSLDITLQRDVFQRNGFRFLVTSMCLECAM